MARAKYQVLVIPYSRTADSVLYCVFKRSDTSDCWQFVAGSGANSMMHDPNYAVKFLNEFSDRILYGCDICNPSNRHQYQFNDFLNKMLADKMISEENYYKLVRGNAVKLLKLEEN